jgi:hypothetical protein
MEQSCYKCGQVLEEGVPFCPHCAAPQIRVIMAEPVLSPAASSVALPGSPAAADRPPVPSIAVPMSWSLSAQPCALAAFIAAVAMVLKLVVPVIAVFGAGFLAVAFYRRRAPDTAIHAKSGARLGAVCGFFCFGITTILESAAVLVLHRGEEIRRMMLDAIRQTAARYPDPQFQQTLDFMRSPGGMVFMMVFFLIFALAAFLVLGTLGGALGGAVFGRRDRT